MRTNNIGLGEPLDVPTGEWILCGYGRMGRWLHKYFGRHGIHPVVIDPDIKEVEGASRVINGHANPGLLEEAGIQQAAGIVAGTDSDHDNLSILMCVGSLRPNPFTIVRQDSH